MRDSGGAWHSPWFDYGAAALLFVLVLVVYANSFGYGFVAYDDSDYVAHNSHVLAGLNGPGVRWAMTSTQAGNWIPLTWISLMADRQFFPSADEIPPEVISARAHHRTNVLLHALTTVLLFLLFRRMTGFAVPSFLLALFFGLHPLRVESVAWVSERKDVLSGLFWMLALHAYISYAARPRAWRYLLTLLLYVAGFMAKPMVITLPLVLVLLDVWPLRRVSLSGTEVRSRPMRSSLWEKLPFYLLAVAMSAVTIAVQHSGGAVRTLQESPLDLRLANALLSSFIYVGKTIWPARLAVLYPFADVPSWQLAAAGLFLASITVLALRAKSLPYLFTGWFWYLITVLPVIGIVQVGVQARADRYTYIPAIGLDLILIWGGADIWLRWPKTRPVLAGAAAVAAAACILLTVRQIPYWHDSVALFQHAVDVTGPNALAHGYLGDVWRAQDMYGAAAEEYRAGLAIAPRNVNLLVDLGDSLVQSGQGAEAIGPLNEAVRLQPGDAVIRNLLGGALIEQGRTTEAIAQLREAIQQNPRFAEAHASLGIALERGGDAHAAVAELNTALKLRPDFPAARQNLQRIETEQARRYNSGRSPH